jgi:enamine deaminase RidA (YjgF/YER057c/UK114 family)
MIPRRQFLVHGGLLSLGAAAGLLWRDPFSTASGALQADKAEGPSPEERVRELKLELPVPGASIATFVPAVLSGNLLFVSGHISRKPDGSPLTGKLGANMDIAQGAAAARTCALGVLGSARATLGSLDKIQRLVKVLGMVNSTPEFTDQPKVINGFSDLLVEIFGAERGKGARSAVGMSSLPSGVAVEVEAIFEVRK